MTINLPEMKRQTRQAVQHNVSLDVIVETVWNEAQKALTRSAMSHPPAGFLEHTTAEEREEFYKKKIV